MFPQTYPVLALASPGGGVILRFLFDPTPVAGDLSTSGLLIKGSGLH